MDTHAIDSPETDITRTVALVGRICASQTNQELDTALAAVAAAFDAGLVPKQEVDELGGLMVARGRFLHRGPDKVPFSIPAEDLLQDKGCPCCGQSRSWVRSGRRICATCHPPASQVQARVAA